MKVIMNLRFLALFIALFLSSPGYSQFSQIEMTDKEILTFLSGNSIGAHDWPTQESFEYHSPDGVAIWQEDQEIQMGQYRIKNSRVCYSYEDSEFSEWFCWDFKKDRRTGEVYQWSNLNEFYRLYILGSGDLVSSL